MSSRSGLREGVWGEGWFFISGFARKEQELSGECQVEFWLTGEIGLRNLKLKTNLRWLMKSFLINRK
jgi:hypothetical protein